MTKRDPVIDLHHHFLPRAVFDRLKAEARGERRLSNDHISISLTEDLHDVAQHLRVMDEAGVDSAVLTYSGVSLLGPEVCRLLNDGFAEVGREAAGRFLEAVHVSLNDPRAVTELERCVADLNPVAVALPTSELGKNLDDPTLLRLWQCIAETGLPVILHPALLPPGASRDYALERSCARPFETTLAAVRIAYGVAPKVKGLRVVLPHLGGTCIFLRGRMGMFFDSGEASFTGALPKTMSELKALGLASDFDAIWSCFYYDTAGSGGWAPAATMALDVVGPSRLVFGSDYPLEVRSARAMQEMIEMIDSLPVSAVSKTAIKNGNARNMLFPVAFPQADTRCPHIGAQHEEPTTRD
jgi:predicted TIM-barrel fold metal-dependent hydrolase